MKKYILILLGMLVSVSLFSQKLSNKERELLFGEKIKELVDAKRFAMDINRASDEKGRNYALYPSYEIRIVGDTIKTVLPFYGTSIGAGYDVDNNRFILNQPYEEYSVKYKDKKGYNIYFKVRSNKDTFVFRISITLAGNVRVGVTSMNNSPMNYVGDFKLIEE
ncbi:MAG: DUF4251 domain-containing protein [Bacteroidales bacterium]